MARNNDALIEHLERIEQHLLDLEQGVAGVRPRSIDPEGG
jgi:hypothetical protein